MTTMTPLTDEQWLNNAYLNTFGRSAVTGDSDIGGGAQYWLDQMAADPTGHSRDNVLNALQQSSEGQSFAADGVVRPGGVRRTPSTFSQGLGSSDPNAANYNPNFNAYSAHFQPNGALAGMNSANVLNHIAANSYLADETGAQTADNVAGGYFQFADEDVTPSNTVPGGSSSPAQIDTSQFLTNQGLQDWWEGVDKPWLNQTDTNNSGGKDDFKVVAMAVVNMATVV